ncbi:MAG: DUF697 domain-containing protein [Gammaproteobacteria bacterium]
MKIFGRGQSGWRNWFSRRKNQPAATESDAEAGDTHLQLARQSLSKLLDDPRVPASVREQLALDYQDLRRMLDKLEHGHVHIAVFGRVGVGKSSLLNALLGEDRFSVSALHGETRETGYANWHEERSGGVFLIDTPGIDEIDGEQREAIAKEAAMRADLLIFVVEADLTAVERSAIKELAVAGRPMLVALNKSDRYTGQEIEQLEQRLAEHLNGIVARRDIIPVCARPVSPQSGAARAEKVEVHTLDNAAPASSAQVQALRMRLWDILEREGKTLAAINASLFAGQLSEAIGGRVVEARRQVAEKLVRTYCVAKGVAVAFNPVPIADLFAAAMIDGGMIVHLSRVYGLPLNRREAGSLVSVIVTQLAALMGTVWVLHLLSSLLKAGTGGLSVLLTGGAQGAVAYYSTYVVGRAAERYFALGKSWGEAGPRAVVAEIMESVDRESILRQARSELKQRIGSAKA